MSLNSSRNIHRSNSNNNLQPIPRRLNFGNGNNNGSIRNNNGSLRNNEIPTQSFEDYLADHKLNVERNIDELMNYDKDKLILKIIENIENIKHPEELQDKSFGELWDTLINHRITRYTKTFDDKDHEKIMINIFKKLSRAYEDNYSNSQNSVVSEGGSLLETLNNDGYIVFIDDIKTTNENLFNLFTEINTFDISLLKTSIENCQYHYGVLLDFLNINSEKIQLLKNEDLDATNEIRNLILTEMYEVITSLFGYEPEDAQYSINFEKFMDSEEEWFLTVLLLYCFKKLKIKLHDSLLTSKIFTKETHIYFSESDNTSFGFLSKFTEIIILPFFKEIFDLDILDEFTKLFKTNPQADEYRDLFVNPDNEKYVWELQENGIYKIKKEVFYLIYDFPQFRNKFIFYTSIIMFYKIFFERSLSTDIGSNNGDLNGGSLSSISSISSVNSEVYNLPESIDIVFSITPQSLEVQPNITSEIEDLINIESKNNLNSTMINTDDEDSIILTFQKFKTFIINNNIELHESIASIMDLDDSKVIDIYRNILFDPDEEDFIKNFKKDDLILFILKDETKHKMVLMKEYKYSEETPRLMIPLVNKTYDSINYNDFPYLIELSSSIKQLLEFEEHGINGFKLNILISDQEQFTPSPTNNQTLPNFLIIDTKGNPYVARNNRDEIYDFFGKLYSDNFESIKYNNFLPEIAANNSNIAVSSCYELFKEFVIEQNIEFQEEYSYLNNLNDELIDIYRQNPYVSENIRDFNEEPVLFVIQNENNTHKLIGINTFKNRETSKITYYVLFDNTYDPLTIRTSFPLKIEVSPYTKSQLNVNTFEFTIDTFNNFNNGNNFDNSNNHGSNILYNYLESNINSVDLQVNSLSQITDTISNIPSKIYNLHAKFYDSLPKDYKFGKYDIETSFYKRDDIEKVKSEIQELLIDLYISKDLPMDKSSLLLNDVYLRIPNIEQITDLDDLKDGEYIIVTYKNNINNKYYVSFLQYNKKGKILINMYQTYNESEEELVGCVLNYNGSDIKLVDTNIRIDVTPYSVFNKENYKNHNFTNISFNKSPQENAISSNNFDIFDRRLFKLFKYNYTFDDSKPKSDYFYMKQYFERIFNISNLDHNSILDAFKEIINQDKNIIDKFKDIPLITTEYHGYDRDMTQDTGIDDGGLRPSFFRDIGEELRNTFLSNLIKKKHEIDVEGKIRGIISLAEENNNYSSEIPKSLKKLQQCNYLNEEECKASALSDRKDDCYFNEDYSKCEAVNEDVPLVITKNEEKYNAFCRYNIPIEDSYKLAGALLGKMLSTDNGVVLKQYYNVPRISVPRLNLSYYLSNRLIDNGILDWVDLISCLKLDDPEQYNNIIGVKCDLEDKNKKLYSIRNKLDEIDDSILYSQGYTSSYSCNEFKDKFGGEDMCEYFSKENYLSNVYLKILEFYETNCLKEYFYLSRGFNMIINPKLLEDAVGMELNPGVLHKLFFGKNVSINELIDVEYINLNEMNRNIKNYYEDYVHNLFVIDDSKIKFKFFKENKAENIFNDQNEILLFKETDAEIIRNFVIMENHNLLGFYRLEENIGRPLNKDDTSNNALYDINIKTISEPIMIVTEGIVPGKGIERVSILKLPNNNFIQVLSSYLPKLDLKSNLSSFFLINSKNNIVAKPELEYNNTKEHDIKIQRLLQFWTSQSVVPNKPKLTINILDSSDRIPSSHTCYNQLDIPYCDSFQIFKDKIELALANYNPGEAFVEENMYGGRLKKNKSNKKSKYSRQRKKNTAKRRKYYIKRK